MRYFYRIKMYNVFPSLFLSFFIGYGNSSKLSDRSNSMNLIASRKKNISLYRATFLFQ